MNNELTNQELQNVSGGAIKWAVVAGIAAGVAFISGIIDGFLRPFSCNK